MKIEPFESDHLYAGRINKYQRDCVVFPAPTTLWVENEALTHKDRQGGEVDFDLGKRQDVWRTGRR